MSAKTEAFCGWWIDWIIFGGPAGLYEVMDWTADNAGMYAALVLYILLFIPAILLVVAGMLLTGVVVVVAALLFPIILPITIYLHRRKS